MTKAIYTILVFAAFAPAAAFAQIVSTTEAGTDTGGNTAGSGGVVETGSSGASVQTTNTVGSNGGTVNITIKTEENGVVREESVTKKVPSGETTKVEVSATSLGSSARAEGSATVIVSSTTTEESLKKVWGTVQGLFPWFDIEGLSESFGANSPTGTKTAFPARTLEEPEKEGTGEEQIREGFWAKLSGLFLRVFWNF